MDLIDMTHDDRIALMRKRHAYFNSLVKNYISFADFINDMDEQLAIWGIELWNDGDSLCLYISLGYSEYEEYTITKGADGHLTVSDDVGWQDDSCANSVVCLADSSQK